MDRRQRTIVGLLWLAVSGVMALTLDIGVPSDANAIARLFVVIVALFLATIYLFDPWGIISRQPFH